ncbi:MAG TPA: DUF2306 domain-containing protein [Streptomyces sp.]|uniref:DUF2306 domain-containing protein n=1 Tax=Streptomyces sp. TaxID=1931 RepID=UPI002C64AB9E|nr:DUF2306 domain-containing protein [Streptomyces sp.]HWU11082.1 DUF2306 domain-containing protein [Streptomyces sp.]
MVYKSDSQPGAPAAAEPVPERRRPWWRRPWMIPLAIVNVVFLTYIWRPYVTLDPATATVQLVAGIPAHYFIVLVHVFGSGTAMICAFFQVWPWLRRKHPRVHARTGRLYMVAVTAATVTAVALQVIRNVRDGSVQAGAPGLYITALLWLAVSLAGYRAARRGDYVLHGRWMTYSFALAMTNIYSRPLYLMLEGSSPLVLNSYFEMVGWLPWIVHLGLARWWLGPAGTRGRQHREPRQPRTEIPQGAAR